LALGAPDLQDVAELLGLALEGGTHGVDEMDPNGETTGVAG
jgi:hypothetical protein